MTKGAVTFPATVVMGPKVESRVDLAHIYPLQPKNQPLKEATLFPLEKLGQS